MQGLYCIKNIQTNRRYIGSSKNVSTRLKQHLSSLKKGTHHCVALQQDFTLLGESVFSFIPLNEVKSESDLIIAEQYAISCEPYLYNTQKTVGRKFSCQVKKQQIRYYQSIWKKQLYPYFPYWGVLPLGMEHPLILLIIIPFIIQYVMARCRLEHLIQRERQILKI